MKKKTLVMGASVRFNRYSNIAINRLKKSEIEVVAFGSKKGIVCGVKIDDVLKTYSEIDTITLYLNPNNQKLFYDYIVSLNPDRIIFNPGTENPEFYNILKENNINYEVACTLVLLATNKY